MQESGIDWSDAEAVARLVQQERQRLLAFVHQRMSAALRQRVDADDIIQEVCLSAVRPAGSQAAVVPQRDPFSWLCHVAEQRIIDAHRRYFATAKRDGGREISIDAPLATGGEQVGGFASLLAVSMTTPSQVLSRDAKEHRLRMLIEELPEEQRQAVRLRYVDGLQTREIAARLGKSDVAVRVMLSRTMQKLQAAFPEAE